MAKKTSRGAALRRFRYICHKYLYIEDDSYFDLVFAVVYANKTDDKPVWLYLIGPSSSGKTDILISLYGHRLICMLSELTEAALVSGKIRQKGEEDPSLLPLLDGKILTIKDFTPILTGRAEVRSRILGILRDAFDGKYTKKFGHGKTIEYNSKFGLIAAVTGAIDQHFRAVASLGERFLMYRLPRCGEAEEEERTYRAMKSNTTAEMEAAMRKAAHAVLNLDVDPNLIDLTDEQLRYLTRVAKLVAVGRTEVPRDWKNKEITREPETELAPRVGKQLSTLMRGLTAVREKTIITPDEFPLINKVALDSIPVMRSRMICYLAKRAGKKPTTPKILKVRFGVSDSTIDRILHDLLALRIADKAKKTKFQSGIEWTIKDKYLETLKAMGVC